MKVTFNPSYTSSYNNNNQCKKPSFNGLLHVDMNAESKLMSPIDKKYDQLSAWIGKHFTSYFIDSKPMNWMADKLKNSKNLYQHCLTVGSAITSGMYMYRTLVNDKMDKDRRNTLAVNQGLTFGISTIMAYSLDNFLNKWWNKVTAKFAGYQIGDKTFYKDYVEMSKKAPKEVKEALKERSLYTTLTEKESQLLKNRLEGMKALKTMVIFGLIYRYFVPVVVTKPANIICDKYLAHKKNADVKQA